MKFTSRCRHQFLVTALLQVVCLAGCCVAKSQHRHWLGVHQHKGWGIQDHAKVKPILKSETLGAYIQMLQVRGGSSYGDDYDKRKGGYYGDDRYNQGFDERDWTKDDYQGDREDYRDSYSREAYDGYDDRGRSDERSSNAVQGSISSIQSKIRNGDRRIGVPLLGLGIVFTMLGISLFFNKSLMRLGNLMFIAGIPTTIGPSRTAGYFFQPQKTRATACLFAGILLVFVGWPIVGIALEVFGILNLFGNMFPMFWAIFKNLPIVSSITKNAGGGGSRPQSYSYDRERDRDYRDDPYADDRQGYGDYGDDDPESYY